ncbi:Putative protein of unknown function [Podospora comata]|uniref:Sas10 C-terminal domain-containing protein n=1 Tax=Podospora comata TaxID=48703 RepID=A0ABY6SKR5_PODCO|nr:Putative protein of unknown function [Podospora comata]
MAKKRRVSRKAELAGPRDVDAKDASLTIKTYRDVADSGDEYWAEKDQIMLDSEDEQPRSKRLKKEDDFLEVSDEEVFQQDGSDESEDEAPAKKGKGKKVIEQYSEDEEQQEGEEEGDEGWWGNSKKEYYDADQIETEADALAEEAEAKRLQAKKLAKMTEEDFAFDEDEWMAPKEEAGEDEVVTEVLKEVEVREDMTPEERYKLLQSRYPEFEYLVDEFAELQPVLSELQKDAVGKPAKSLEVVKSWILGCYVASLASYFALLTSPTRDGNGAAATLSPSELRDHEVMGTLMECREAWLKVKQFRPAKPAASETGMLSPPEEEDEVMLDIDEPAKKRKSKLSKAEIRAKEKKEADKARKAKAVEKSLADLSTLLESGKKAAKEDAARAAPTNGADTNEDYSDFGEEDALDEHTAADKAKRKKSLKFYTSQIVQKANKRAGAGRDAGGDMDIPYRERLRDRQARLNAEAERRGKKDSKFGAGAELGGDDSEEEGRQGGALRGAGTGEEGRAHCGTAGARPRRQAPDYIPDPEEQGLDAAQEEGGAQPACEEEDEVRGEEEEAQERAGCVQGRRGQGWLPGRVVWYQDESRQEYQVVDALMANIWAFCIPRWFVFHGLCLRESPKSRCFWDSTCDDDG